MAMGMTLAGGELDERLREMGFVEVGGEGSRVLVELMYGRDDNFTGKRMYDGLDGAWLHPDAKSIISFGFHPIPE